MSLTFTAESKVHRAVGTLLSYHDLELKVLPYQLFRDQQNLPGNHAHISPLEYFFDLN